MAVVSASRWRTNNQGQEETTKDKAILAILVARPTADSVRPSDLGFELGDELGAHGDVDQT